MNLGTLPWWLEDPDPDIYFKGTYLVLDVETTNIEKGKAIVKDNKLLYTGIVDNNLNDYSFHGDELKLSNYLDLIYSVDFLVAHNAKMELQWLARAGADLTKLLVYDTLLGDYVISGNRGWALDLDSVSKRYGGKVKDPYIKALMQAGVCPSVMPRRRLGAYCDGDVANTLNIFLKQRQVLKDNGLLPIAYTRNVIAPFISDIEMVGMHLDDVRVKETHHTFVKEHAKIVEELTALTGGINMASPKQVAQFVYGDLGFEELKGKDGKPLRTDAGNPRTDEETITSLKPRNKKQKEFIKLKLEESKLRKKITTYTTMFVNACDEHACMIYGNINQSVTRTQRLSSSNPNRQNIDRDLKRLFNSRYDGYVIGSNDYKQLEYRVAGILADDPEVKHAIDNNEDVHQYTADTLTNAGQPTTRQDAKSRTFKPLYGGVSGTEAEKAYYTAFKIKYKKITEMQDQWVESCLDTGKYTIPTGLIYYFPSTKMMASGYIVNNESIKNYPVQCIATGDIAPIGATCLWHRLKSLKLNSFIINIVHDSVETEEDPKENSIVGNLVTQSMSKDIIPYFDRCFGLNLHFPLEVERKVTTHWGQN